MRPSTLTLIAVLAASPAAADGFFDDFDSLDRDVWYISNGWTNGAHQNCIWKRSEIDVAGGELTLTLKKSEVTSADGQTTLPYRCAELQTKKRFGYGLYEARVRAAEGSGLNSAFFTYIGPADGEKHDEVDVEILGRDMMRFDSNYYSDGEGQNQGKIPLPAAADSRMIDYAFEWTEGRIRWFVNGQLMREVVSEDVPDQDQKIFFSLWNGGKGMDGWLGAPDDTIEQRVMKVAHVGFTPVGERCRFAASLSCADGWNGW